MRARNFKIILIFSLDQNGKITNQIPEIRIFRSDQIRFILKWKPSLIQTRIRAEVNTHMV